MFLAVAVALAITVSATELQFAITPNGAARESNTVNPTNFTFTLTTTDINAYTNFWFIATIPPGQFGNDTANANARMDIRTVAPSNRPRSQQFPNATAEGDGYATNGQVVVTLEPRYNKLFITQNTNLKFRVKSSGDFADTAFVPYNASLFTKAYTNVLESNGGFGHVGQWDGTVYTGTVPCCGAKVQIPVTPNARQGYYFSSNITALNNTLYSASLWESSGARNMRLFDPAPSPTELQPSVAVKTCDGSDVCNVFVQVYYLEVQSPADSQYAAQFQYTYTVFPAANAPGASTAGTRNFTLSSTGLNAATAHAPSTLIAAFTVLFAALLAVFTH